jgi:hypothetical protein
VQDAQKRLDEISRTAADNERVLRDAEELQATTASAEAELKEETASMDEQV